MARSELIAFIAEFKRRLHETDDVKCSEATIRQRMYVIPCSSK